MLKRRFGHQYDRFYLILKEYFVCQVCSTYNAVAVLQDTVKGALSLLLSEYLSHFPLPPKGINTKNDLWSKQIFCNYTLDITN